MAPLLIDIQLLTFFFLAQQIYYRLLHETIAVRCRLQILSRVFSELQNPSLTNYISFPITKSYRIYNLNIQCFRFWKVFYDDKDRRGRYLLAKELLSRPDAEELQVR